MYCPNCGKQLPDQANFCGYCGSRLDQRIPSPAADLPEGIFLGEDGTYRWMYEVNLWKNNPIAGSLVKVMLLLLFVVVIPVLLINGTDLGTLIVLVPVLVIAGAALVFLGYVISAAMNGGKYCAVFAMDEEKIIHAQSKKQVDRGRLLAVLSMALSDPETGLSLLASEKFVSSYRDVKKISLEPARHLIRVNETFVKNQIYVHPNQFEFVADYVTSRCPNAVIKKK